MQLSSYYYDLPQKLIAQTPIEKRDNSRLLTLNRQNGEISDNHFYDITRFLNAGDCLVINDTKVLPSRIFAKSNSHAGEIEVVLLNRLLQKKDSWSCLVRPGKKAKIGEELVFSDELSAKITEITDGGLRTLDFSYEGNFMEILDKIGIMPLPPYIKEKLDDKNRYQTVYAKYEGSAAAPTAGLHFTPELLNTLEDKGVIIARICLHVGIGTFRPVKEQNVLEHKMHSEHIRVTAETAEIINNARKNGGRIIAVGTTSCRTLESCSDSFGTLHPYEGETDIFIYPSYKFKIMDALITNFHLP
ncbi:MAG: tRNA preQ1(34) S-adenosylmethionine ribosyltransferase-isomerase QueA, partial [Clostridia bacterium]